MKIEKEYLPQHVGIIMDGNGRWASARGLSRSMGHKAGSKALKKLCEYIYDIGIPILSVFAFSTENFKREQKEVDYLMNLFVHMFEKEFAFLKNKNIRVIFSGRKEGLPQKVLLAMDKIVEDTKDCNGSIFHICINYGGQYEILDMVRKIATKVKDEKQNVGDIQLDTIRENLYHPLPDLDLVIRTSGELRISNFMLYQGAYAEYYFTNVLFPDFDKKQFDLALEEYRKRTRKFGG